MADVENIVATYMSGAVLASPFDTELTLYVVSSSHSGDHCGGFKVVGVDRDGKAVTDFSDGD